jgi:hypothetical protein
MRLMLPAERAELFHLETFSGRLLIFGFAVVAVLALGALKLDNLSRHFSLPFISQLSACLRARFCYFSVTLADHAHRLRSRLSFKARAVPFAIPGSR